LAKRGVSIGRLPKRRTVKKKWKNNSGNPKFGSNDSFRTRNE
tara:strand:+ start:223 stop:348 length:126 start_codon:yes stop_codon:yes gene_type:complete